MGLPTALTPWPLLLSVLLTSGVQSESAHPEKVVAWGRCPSLPAAKNFTFAAFAGEWSMSHQFRQPRFLPCQKFDFQPTSNHSMAINGSVQAEDSLTLGIQGTAVARDPREPGVLSWAWNYLPSFVERVTVIDTDYNTYAVLALCQDFGIFHANFGFFLTRNEQLYKTEKYHSYLDRARTVLGPFMRVDYSIVKPCRFYDHSEDENVLSGNIDISNTISEIGNFASKFSRP